MQNDSQDEREVGLSFEECDNAVDAWSPGSNIAVVCVSLLLLSAVIRVIRRKTRVHELKRIERE